MVPNSLSRLMLAGVLVVELQCLCGFGTLCNRVRSGQCGNTTDKAERCLPSTARENPDQNGIYQQSVFLTPRRINDQLA